MDESKGGEMEANTMDVQYIPRKTIRVPPQYLKNNWTTTCMNTFLAITLMDLKINNAEHENVVEFKMLVSKVSYQN